MFQSKILAAIAVVFTFAFTTAAQAAIVSSIVLLDADPSVVGDISNSDLINTGSGALAGVSSSGYSATGGLGVNASPNAVLNDGQHGYRPGAPSMAASSSGPWLLTYSLSGAYDIDSIVSHSAAHDNRGDQDIDVYFEYDGNPGVYDFVGKYTHKGWGAPFNGSTIGHWKLTIEDDGGAAIGTNVTGIQFQIWNGVVAPTVFSEIDVFEASAVPEPSSFVLVGLGLVGLAGWGLRRRRVA